jgi:hypothetical protein
MRTIVIFAALVVSMFAVTGCPKTRSDMPPVVAERVRNYAVVQFDSDYGAYNTAVAEGRYDDARMKRDELVFKLKKAIDANYADFENSLYVGKATSNVLFDAGEFGAVLAGTITNGERVKTIISSSLSAFKGGRKSVDINFFRERTTESLILTMRASRSNAYEKINIGLRNNVRDYTLEEALGHLIDYFYAGSLSNALVTLSNQASVNAVNAKAAADDQEKKRLQANVSDSRDINTLRNDLYKKIKNGTDSEKEAARQSLLRALKELRADKTFDDVKISVDEKASAEDLFAELQRILKAAAAMDQIPTEAILKALRGK